MLKPVFVLNLVCLRNPELFPSSSNNMCGRSDFLIHGGNCGSGNPSIGCIVIESESTRYMIKSGATLKVVA